MIIDNLPKEVQTEVWCIPDACADESYVGNYDSLRLFEIHDWLQIEE